MKICSKCKTPKMVDEFYPFMKNGKEYRHSWCKKCASGAATKCCTRLRRTNPKSRLVAFKDLARRRDLVVETSDENLCSMFTKPCYYCGHPTTECLNGIDRIDSNCGYIEGNIVSCCGNCNFAKRDLSEKDFLQLIKRIAIHQGWLGE